MIEIFESWRWESIGLGVRWTSFPAIFGLFRIKLTEMGSKTVQFYNDWNIGIMMMGIDWARCQMNLFSHIYRLKYQLS